MEWWQGVWDDTRRKAAVAAQAPVEEGDGTDRVYSWGGREKVVEGEEEEEKGGGGHEEVEKEEGASEAGVSKAKEPLPAGLVDS